MSENTFNPMDMPIMGLSAEGSQKVSRFEASRYLDNPETISAFLAEALQANDASILMKSLAEVAKAHGVNQLAADAGVNRESLYKTLKGGEKTRFDTVQKLLNALGVELTVKPLGTLPAPSKPLLRAVPARKVAAPAKAPAKPLVKPAAKPAQPARIPAAASSRSRNQDGQIRDKSPKAAAKKPTAKKPDSHASA